jgi:CheY-like chemotaxis protein
VPEEAASAQPVVLIAEDEEVLRKILVQSFQAAGYKTLEAANGEEALAQALKDKPAVTILDIMMPKMDGMEALKKMRLDPWGKTAMVIMLTNLTADNKILQDLSESAPSYYFVKSDMEPDQLIAKVKEIIG